MPPPSSSAAADPPSKRPPAVDDSGISLAPFPKRTRALPNLSYCQACNFRITNNGQDRLRTLDSFWRIVILCCKCFDRVDCADLCAYCLSQLGECPTFGCRDCKRRVHKDCVSEFKSSAPWSYCPCLESVCLDCWLPSSMAKFASRKTSAGIGKVQVKLGSGKVEDVDVGRNKILDKVSETESLQDMVKVVNCEVKRKLEIAARAKEKALRKVVLAKSAVELATGALDLVVRRDDNNGTGGSEVLSVDDAELAFRLHRAMNSSPRISRKLRDVDCDDDSLGGKGSECGIITPNGTVCEEGKECQGNNTTRMGVTEMGMNGDFDAKPDAEDYKLDLPLKEGGGSCSNKLANSCAGISVLDGESQSCEKQDMLGLGLHPSDSGTQCGSECGRYTVMEDKGCIKNPDRYFRKYCKRNAALKAVLNPVTKAHREGPGLPLNCTKSSETFNDASFQSCAVPVQASASVRYSS